MISFLRGKLWRLDSHSALIDVSGVGYRVFVLSPPKERALLCGQEVFLYTVPVIREDSHQLYGFTQEETLLFFEHLMVVSGIGPRLAMSILNQYSTGECAKAIIDGDVRTLCALQGVGKKTAERMIIELKDRVLPFIKVITGSASTVVADAVAALVNLGFVAKDAKEVVDQVMHEIQGTIEIHTLVSYALQHSAKKS